MISFRFRKKYIKNQPLEYNKKNEKIVFFLFKMYSNSKK